MAAVVAVGGRAREERGSRGAGSGGRDNSCGAIGRISGGGDWSSAGPAGGAAAAARKAAMTAIEQCRRGRGDARCDEA